jgi:hypothetical protein
VRILVTGSRDWDDWQCVYRELTALCDEHDLNYPPDEYGNTLPDPRKVTVVHGACPRGADHWADQWAIGNCDLGLTERHPAKWDELGKRAGFVRNAEMVNLGADVCLAFIKNGSRGATHTADLAEKAGIPVRRFLA